MNAKVIAATVLSMVFVHCAIPASGSAYTFQLFRFGDALGTFPNAIDNEGNVSGNLATSDPQWFQRGFLRRRNGSFEYIDFDGRDQTVPLGSNNFGVIVGDTVGQSGGRRGFIRQSTGMFEEFNIFDGGYQVNDINDLAAC